MMKTNPHFRILALTATPGNTPEQVQPIIDNLHISHIAIRNDSSQDIKQYTHKKVFEEHIIKMDYFIDELCMQWEDVVKVSNVNALNNNLKCSISVQLIRSSPKTFFQTTQLTD